MSNIDQIASPEIVVNSIEFKESLRPARFEDFPGQERIKDNLKVYIEAAVKRGDTLDHILLHGPPGLGKTTLAAIIAREMGVNVKPVSGPSLQSIIDLSGILTNLGEGDILFIDEIHRVNRAVEEYLYPAMEEFVIDIVIDQGPKAKSVRLNLDKFTMVGATTRAGLLTPALRSRFGIIERFDFYSISELESIITRSARLLKVSIDDEGAREIAGRSRGTARMANRLLKRVRDFAEVKSDGVITLDVAKEFLLKLNVDEKGLSEMDRSILVALISKFKFRATGLTNLAAAVSEEPHTIEEVYEPYLIKEGFLERTSRGRKATPMAHNYLEHILTKRRLSNV